MRTEESHLLWRQSRVFSPITLNSILEILASNITPLPSLQNQHYNHLYSLTFFFHPPSIPLLCVRVCAHANVSVLVTPRVLTCGGQSSMVSYSTHLPPLLTQELTVFHEGQVSTPFCRTGVVGTCSHTQLTCFPPPNTNENTLFFEPQTPNPSK